MDVHCSEAVSAQGGGTASDAIALRRSFRPRLRGYGGRGGGSKYGMHGQRAENNQGALRTRRQAESLLRPLLERQRREWNLLPAFTAETDVALDKLPDHNLFIEEKLRAAMQFLANEG